jgi:hypothetical protein
MPLHREHQHQLIPEIQAKDPDPHNQAADDQFGE